jgi:chloramphenicol-sensitive protein RarD
MNAGVLYAVTAFGIWGLFPLYLRQIATVPPLELVLHRSVWALVFLAGVLAALRRWGWLRELLADPRRLRMPLLTALLLSSNWLLYVMAVQSGQVVEASLGYFINPLLNVVLGVVVLRERLAALQWAAVALAAAGVAWLTWHTGRLPWIALSLAATFGVYGLLRKTARLGPLEGLATETLILAPVFLPALAWWTLSGQGSVSDGNLHTLGWLMLGGPLTALPLMLFAAAARRLPLATVGLLQYLSPSLQLVCAVWWFHEPFDAVRQVGFALIWCALAVYSASAWRSRPAAAAG